MKNKGFTLVELLAVIAILGILVLVTLPNIVESFNKSKDKNFVSEAQAIYKTAKNQYVMDSAKGYITIAYVKGFSSPSGIYSKEMDVSSRQGFNYLVKISEEGEIYYFLVEDDSHEIELGSENNPNDIVEFKEVTAAFVSSK